MNISNKASGCLFGLAFGDALGADTEFMKVAEILQRYPPNGPQELQGSPALVTDDTQMALAVGEALLEAEKPLTAATLEGPLRQAFVEWMRSPDNTRAPGNTCMVACAYLAKGENWYKATVPGSKGCGANMRVAPVALLKDVDERTMAAIAQFQAALTHGHPTALAASDLTAKTISLLLSGTNPVELPALLRVYAHSQRMVYYADWLGPLWERPGMTTPEDYIARGWDDCLAVLDRLDKALLNLDRDSDPCLATGDGWVAEEAFATGLLCFLMFPNDPVAAIRRAAVTKGDSDSIACLAGAFGGAYHGLSVWPEVWVQQIEYKDRLTRLGAEWD